MKKLLPILAVLTATAAIALFFWSSGPGETQSEQAAAPPPDKVQPQRTPIAAAKKIIPETQETLTLASFEQLKEEQDLGYDPMLAMALGAFTDEQIDVYNAHHIIPFNPAIGSDCEELPDSRLTGQNYTSCKTVREHLPHPYNDLDQQALLDLAAMDPAAALILGRRALEEEERLQWYLRATALSEKSGPLLALAERRYSSAFELKTVAGKVRQVANPENLVKRVALETVAQKLGDPRAKPQNWIELLKTMEDGARLQSALHSAENAALTYIRKMADIQRDTTGSVSMEGLLDV